MLFDQNVFTIKQTDAQLIQHQPDDSATELPLAALLLRRRNVKFNAIGGIDLLCC